MDKEVLLHEPGRLLPDGSIVTLCGRRLRHWRIEDTDDMHTPWVSCPLCEAAIAVDNAAPALHPGA